MKNGKFEGRQARWIEKILEFDFEILHIAGTTNILADALSRIYTGDLPGTVRSSSEYTQHDDTPPMQLNAIISQPLEVGPQATTEILSPERINQDVVFDSLNMETPVQSVAQHKKTIHRPKPQTSVPQITTEQNNDEPNDPPKQKRGRPRKIPQAQDQPPPKPDSQPQSNLRRSLRTNNGMIPPIRIPSLHDRR